MATRDPSEVGRYFIADVHSLRMKGLMPEISSILIKILDILVACKVDLNDSFFRVAIAGAIGRIAF